MRYNLFNAIKLIHSAAFAWALGSLALAPLEGHAVAAYPYPLEKVQPDGSILTVKIMGDEHCHYLLTDDGKMIAERDGAYYYALPGGNISPMLARNAALRSPEESRLLLGISQPELLEDVRRAAAASPRRQAARRITPQMPSNPIPGLFNHQFPSKGKQRSLVILVEYQDVKFSTNDAARYFHDMLNKEGFSENGCNGSARDFYIEASTGQFQPDFDVYGPVLLKNTRRYYGGNTANGDDEHADEMAIEACRALDDEVDFSVYDSNGDGVIDNVFIFYAGQGEATGGPAESVWPHSYSVFENHDVRLDGVRLATYGCSNELVPRRDAPRDQLFLDVIGTFCHEFGHVMGLPDLYATSYTTAHDPAEWSIMASGSYNNNSCTPPTFSSFERAALGWLEPERMPNGDITMAPLTRENKAYIVPTEDPDEFFLFEMRAAEGWDEYLPGVGLLVWHIDYDKKIWDRNSCNNDKNHQYIDIVESHGSEYSAYRPFDAFPGLDDTMDFSATTKPALVSWSGADLGVSLSNIRLNNDCDEVMFTAVNKHFDGSGIESPVAGKGFSARGRMITAFQAIEIYDPAGMHIASLSAGSSAELPAAGIYIVRSTEGARKIAVF